MRLRLKADGRIVEILADGSERGLAPPADPGRRGPEGAESARGAVEPEGADAASAKEAVALYSRNLRSRTKLTQAEFAARIGVPIETVRNWEQGKRAPRGPARALLKVIEKAPELVFAALAGESAGAAGPG
jgi:putative transcriptional regulator